jgi:hypothetical protein
MGFILSIIKAARLDEIGRGFVIDELPKPTSEPHYMQGVLSVCNNHFIP